MPSLAHRVNLLRALPGQQRAAALASALSHAGPQERELLLAEALDAAPALPGLVFRAALLTWPVLGPTARGATLGAIGPGLAPLLTSLRQESAPLDRPALISLTISCLASLLASGPDAALPIDRRDPVLRSELDAGIAALAAEYTEHRRPEVLDAVARLAHAPGPLLRAWLADQGQAGHLPLRAAARSLPADLVRDRLVSWLAVPPLAAMARDCLQQPAVPEALGAWLERSHLLLARSRGVQARRFTQPERLLMTPESLVTLPVPARRGQVRWARTLSLRPDQRTQALALCLTDPEPIVRLSAVHGIAESAPSPAGDALLADFAFDDHPVVAAAATSTLALAGSSARRQGAAPTLRTLRRSPHLAVRRLALACPALHGEWPSLLEADPLVPPLAARRRLAARPGAFVEEWRAHWGTSAGDARLRLLDLAWRLRILARLEPELVEAVTAGDRRVASKAVLLLGGLGGRPARRAIAEALSSQEGRIRASAVEALARTEPQDRALEALCSDDVPRVRANALHHRFRIAPHSGEAVRRLAEMLRDERGGHRLSALWLATRLKCTAVLPRITELARADSDVNVHARARRCAGALLAATRHGWAGAAPGPTIVTRPAPGVQETRETAA